MFIFSKGLGLFFYHLKSSLRLVLVVLVSQQGISGILRSRTRPRSTPSKHVRNLLVAVGLLLGALRSWKAWAWQLRLIWRKCWVAMCLILDLLLQMKSAALRSHLLCSRKGCGSSDSSSRQQQQQLPMLTNSCSNLFLFIFSKGVHRIYFTRPRENV